MNPTEQKRLRELAEEFGGYAANCPTGHDCYVEAAIMAAVEPYRAALHLAAELLRTTNCGLDIPHIPALRELQSPEWMKMRAELLAKLEEKR